MVAAYMALADHVKDNLKCLDATKSLLTPNANKFHPANAFKDDIGAYLFNDTNLGEIVRTGSNSGQGFAGRYNDDLQIRKGKWGVLAMQPQEMQPCAIVLSCLAPSRTPNAIVDVSERESVGCCVVEPIDSSICASNLLHQKYHFIVHYYLVCCILTSKQHPPWSSVDC
jgi:hypothetical protein